MTEERPSASSAEDASAVLAIVAHELKNAMGGLGVVLARCEQRLGAGQPVTRENLAEARAELRRLSALVNDLLDGSRVDLGMVHITPAPVDLASLTREVVDMFCAARNREVALDVDVDVGFGRIDADGERVRAVIVNFLENAAKYAPPASEIGVRVSGSPIRKGTIRVAVSDQGPGIHPEDRGRLFQRFFRGNAVAKRTQGLGLGLYVCRAIAEAHAGEVGVDSVPGCGSTFWIDLPSRG